MVDLFDSEYYRSSGRGIDIIINGKEGKIFKFHEGEKIDITAEIEHFLIKVVDDEEKISEIKEQLNGKF